MKLGASRLAEFTSRIRMRARLRIPTKRLIRDGGLCRRLWRKRNDMPRKLKRKFEKGTEARRLARKSGLKPAGTRVIADKRKKPPKHKPDLLREAEPFLGE